MNEPINLKRRISFAEVDVVCIALVVPSKYDHQVDNKLAFEERIGIYGIHIGNIHRYIGIMKIGLR